MEDILYDSVTSPESLSSDYNDSTIFYANATSTVEAPKNFSVVVGTYVVLLVLGAVGNLAVLLTLSRSSRRRSKLDLLMTNLAVADICVICGVIPLEIGWKFTNAWLAGNLACKLSLVLRAFGLYLSSNVLVCISIDRFFAVMYPLRVSASRRRGRHMLTLSWLAAVACSLPQSVVFRVRSHPRVPGFEQCVSFDAFSSRQREVAYNVFCLCAMYFVPLLVITAAYVCIFVKIHRNSKELGERYTTTTSGLSRDLRLRRSDQRVLRRARRRTLRMTVIIVAVFATCWLPYAVMALWYMVDRESASRVSPLAQDLLFAMAVSNSCMNPLVYGSYALDLRGKLRRLLRRSCCANDTRNIGNSASVSSKNKLNKNGRPRHRLGVRFAETCLTVEPPPPPRPPPAPARRPPPRLLCAAREQRRIRHAYALGELV